MPVDETAWNRAMGSATASSTPTTRGRQPSGCVEETQARRISGLAGGYFGRIINLVNANSAQDGDIVLNADDTSSSAANRFA